MDGVVWIGAQAPDSFTLTGLFNQKTVLMLAAEAWDKLHLGFTPKP